MSAIYEPLEVLDGWAWYLKSGKGDDNGEALPKGMFAKLKGKPVDSGVFLKKIYKSRAAALGALKAATARPVSAGR